MIDGKNGKGAVHLFLLCVVAGCSGEPTARVSGRVTVGGEPLAAGQIAFERDGRLLAGSIDAQGGYELRNGNSRDLPPGEYTVLLSPPPPELVADPQTTEMTPVSLPDQSRFPDRYRRPETSGIVRTIPPGESTIDIDFSLP